MSSDPPVSYWIDRLKAGDHQAAQKLWECYFRRLVGLARQKLQCVPRRMADEEDVALSAFHSFCQGAEKGRFPRLEDRSDLWQLLVMITARKAADLIQYERRKKRGGDRSADASSVEIDLEELISREPTPEFAAQVAEQCQRLLGRLSEESLRAVALWKMEGYTTEQIADRLGCVPRTVERKLRLIRECWVKELAS